jgi:hypothetical protein
MSAFDYDAWLSACEPPTFTVGGRTYIGRILSVEQVERHLAALSSAKNDEEAHTRMHDLVSQMFDYRPTSFIDRMRKRSMMQPSMLFEAMPVQAQLAAMQNFSQSLARQLLPTGMKKRRGVMVEGRAHLNLTEENPASDNPSTFKWPPSWPHSDGTSTSTGTDGQPLME